MKNSKKHFFPVFNAGKYHIGLAVAQFNNDITEQILASAKEKLRDYKILESNITVAKVAGSVELPVILQSLAKTKKYDCLIAIGAIIRGQTDHYYFVAKIVTEGVLRVMLDYNLPIGFAVLTTPNKKLAEKRINIGAEAVTAALHNARIIKNFKI